MSDYSMLLARIAELEAQVAAPAPEPMPHPAALPAPDVMAERDALKAENATLHEGVTHLQMSAEQLQTENAALRAQIEALKAAVVAEVQHAETLVPQA